MRWCTLTYWEYNRPFNQQFNVVEHTCHLYQEPTINQLTSLNGFCLKYIQKKTNLINKELLRVRELIGNGFRLFINNDISNHYIWLFNNCDCSLYWICPGLHNLNELNETNFKPNKLKKGESIIVYNYNKVKLNESKKTVFSMNEAHIINISFKKNWGYGSKRKSIEYCPCWVNISVNLDYFC